MNEVSLACSLCNPSAWKLRQDQPGLHVKFQANLGYRARSCLRERRERKLRKKKKGREERRKIRKQAGVKMNMMEPRDLELQVEATAPQTQGASGPSPEQPC